MKRGFTLIEMMVVVGIISILIVLAVPNIMRSRINANENAALGNLRAIFNACNLYSINQETFPGNLSILGEINPPYLDVTLSTGSKQGYNYTYISNSSDAFAVNANPVSLLKGRYFYMDENGVIRANSNSTAGPDDEIVK